MGSKKMREDANEVELEGRLNKSCKILCRKSKGVFHSRVGTQSQVYIFAIAALLFGVYTRTRIFFRRSACLSGQTGGGQSRGHTVQLVHNFKGLPNQSYCS
jgi:hypothetical protein